MRVVSANVQCILDNAAAQRCLEVVLAESPDVVLLQEWALKRVAVLRRHGSVSVVAPVNLPRVGSGGYAWFAPLTGGCAVGLRVDRFSQMRARLRSLSLPGTSESQRIQPGRTALEVRAWDGLNNGPITLVSYHLIPGAERNGAYWPDRPHQARRHRHEKARLQQSIDAALARGEVFAGGDSNFGGFTLTGLVSSWTGKPLVHGRIDDVFAPQGPSALTLLQTESDHQALMVDYEAGASTRLQ